MDFTELTEQHISMLPLSERKKLGQYMTPAPIGNRMAELLGCDPSSSPSVLDPACGTGELLLAALRAYPNVRIYGFDVDDGMVETTRKNVPGVDVRKLSVFEVESRKEYGKYDYVIGNPPYFEMKKDSEELLKGGVDGFASLDDKGRLNIYALFVEYAMRLIRVGGKVSYLIPPSMNNGAFFKCLRKRVLELGYIEKIEMVRENDSFDDALTSVQILVLVRTEDGYEANLAKSAAYVHETGSNIVFTDKKDVIDAFSEGKSSIKSQGFEVKTGTVIWNKFKEDFERGVFEDAGTGAGIAHVSGQTEYPLRSGLVPVLFSKDISQSNTLQLSDKISSNGHWLPRGKARANENVGIIVNRIVGSLDNPHLRFALVELDEFYGENHVNVITRPDGDAEKIRRLYEALSKIAPDELSEYLKAVTGNTQLSATELGEMPVELIS